MNAVTKGALVLCVLVSSGAAAEIVRTKEQSYIVKYTDGTAERYAVKWTLDVTTKMREQRAPPVPYQGADQTPHCSWSVATVVERSVSLVTRLGQPIPVPAMSKTLNKDASASRGEGCKESRAQREKELADAKTAAAETFERQAGVDLESIKKEAQAAAGVVAITVQ